MPGPNSAISSVDGSLSFKGGVDSLKAPTIQSEQNPNGLRRDQLAWLTNGTVRDDGITPRAGWKKLYKVADGTFPYQGGYMYRPEQGNPYIVSSIGGTINKIEPDAGVTDLTLTSTVRSIATAGPWTITLRNQSFTTVTSSTVFYHDPPPPLDGPLTPTDFPVPGDTFSDSNSQYLHLIGDGFTPFVIPASGADVEVTLSAPYTGSVGDVIKLTGDFSTVEFVGIGTGYFIYRTWISQFEVVAFSPAFQTITTGIQSNPTYGRRSYFCQAEEFLIIQAGDYETPAIFWDGVVLRRSIGITNNAVASGTPGINEIPPAGPMDYYMGRLWYAQKGKFNAGDIVGGNSGSLTYGFRDAVLNVTENPLVLGGDGFSVPRQEGDITALSHNATQDAALGQGRLFAFTEKGTHALSVPVTRTNWIAADANNQPLLVPVQLANGTASDRSVVAVNGDIYYQSNEPHLRSIITAVRQFNQRGNVPISSNIERLLKFTDRSLMGYASGIYFDNRLIETALPIQTPQGCVHQALYVVDFAPISSFTDNQNADANPVHEGMYEGLDVLQLFTGVFDGKERAFALVVNRTNKGIELWEMTKDDRFDNIDSRIQTVIEFPAFTWGQVFALKKLISGEMWIDRLYGETIFLIEYRPDGESCWIKWHDWKECSPRNTCENINPDPCTGLTNVQCYPMIPYGESYVQTLTLPKPPENCAKKMGRPSYIGYQFQVRLTMKGFARIRGLLLHAEPIERKLYENMRC